MSDKQKKKDYSQHVMDLGTFTLANINYYYVIMQIFSYLFVLI